MTKLATSRAACRLRISALRKGKKGHTIHVPIEQNEQLKAIAAAQDRNVQAYLEELVMQNIAANLRLVPLGQKKLLQRGAPRRVRTRQLEQENAQLRAQLAKLKSHVD